MYVFSVLVRSFKSGVEHRERRNFPFTDYKRAESARKFWVDKPEQFPVSPIVKMTGGAK